MRHLTHLVCTIVLIVSLVGCGPSDETAKKTGPPTTSNQDRQPPTAEDPGDAAADTTSDSSDAAGAEGSPEAEQPAPQRRRPSGMRNGDNLSMGGGGRIVSAGDSNSQATAEANRRRPFSRQRGPRPGDNLSMGGGGRIVSAGGGNAPRNNRNNPAPPPGNTGPAGGSGEPAFFGGGLVNGFFPQPIGESFDAGDALVNGFFPKTMTGGNAEFVSIPAPIVPSTTLKADAVSEFQKRNEAEAFKNLYGYLLVSDTAREQYPVRWYSGLREPRAAFRWGVGVIYNAPRGEEEMAPLVVGDPEGSRERERSNSRSGGRRGGGGGGSGGGQPERDDGPGPGGGGSANSGVNPYANVATDHPEGFVLYFTGDYGNELLTRLDSRRTSDEGHYGAILRDLAVDYSEETVTASAPPPRQPSNFNRRGQRSGDNLSMGGVSRPPANRAPRGPVNPGDVGGGDNAGGGAASAARINRVSTSSPSAQPDDNTTGTLMPGVMLVGKGNKDDLVERAKNMGLDGLFLFTVRVSSGRNAIGSCGCKIINLKAADPKDEIVFNGRTFAFGQSC